MSTYAFPVLSIARSVIAAGPVGGKLPPVVAIDELSVTWGRSSVLEQPVPATASLSVLDRSPTATLAARTDLIGQPAVITWVAGDGSDGVTFRGRITGVEVTPDRATGGFRVDLSCSSKEVDAANFRAPKGTAWPVEPFVDRWARIWALLPVGWFTGGCNLPTAADAGLDLADPARNLKDYSAAAVDAGGKDALSMLRELFVSMSPLPMIYDPYADGIRFGTAGAHHAYAPASGMTVSAILAPAPDRGGRYVAQSLARLHLDGGLSPGNGKLSSGLDSRVTRVEVQWSNAGTAATAYGYPADNGLEDTIGRRTLGVSSIHAGTAEAAQLAAMYTRVVDRTARGGQLDPVTYDTSLEPFCDTAHVRALLDGCEKGREFFLGRSWYPRVGRRPLIAVLGGRVAYAHGQWQVQLNPVPATVAGAPSWGPITVRAAGLSSVRLRDLDPSVTAGDVGFVDIGAGFTESTVTPYRGNPTP